MDSVLQSREVDPEEVLYNLGFADSEALAKIPRRFLQKPSVAKGVSIENFRKQQEEIFGRYETGFFGYRGLQGKKIKGGLGGYHLSDQLSTCLLV